MLMGMSTMVIDWIPPDSIFTLTLPLCIYGVLVVLSDIDFNEYNVNKTPDECPPAPPRDPSTMRDVVTKIEVRSRYTDPDYVSEAPFTYKDDPIGSGFMPIDGEDIVQVTYVKQPGDDGMVKAWDKYGNQYRCEVSKINDNTPDDAPVFRPYVMYLKETR